MKKHAIFLSVALCLLCSSCAQWGEMDDPAGNQKNPVPPDASTKMVAYFPLDSNFVASDSLFTGEAVALVEGALPDFVEDVDRGAVLHQNGGYTRLPNPLLGLDVAQGATLTMWVKIPETEITPDATIFSFMADRGDLFFARNASLSYAGVGGWFNLEFKSGPFYADQWHFVAVILTRSGFKIYIDGEQMAYDHDRFSCGDTTGVTNNAFDFANMVDLLTSAPYIYLGYGNGASAKEIYFDDIKIYKNASKDISPNVVLPEAVYINTFDTNNTATITGGGSFVNSNDPKYNMIFQNISGGRRANYLLLPDDVLSHSVETKALTVGVWVNAEKAGTSASYMWAPLFMAYGAAPAGGGNTWPMLACQYRGVVQVNCAGWCDFTPAQNVAGSNKLYHDTAADWLADRKWHYYTAVFTETAAAVYFDGELANAWEVSGVGAGNEIAGLFSNGADLKYICLGGNQAWDWADDDPGFMFDDIAIYNLELSPAQIALIIEAKNRVNP